MDITKIKYVALITIVVVLAGITYFGCDGKVKPGFVLDEARLADRDADSFPAADEDYFKDSDGGVSLTPEEVEGRNTWLVWTGGNDRIWNELTVRSFGSLDLLKTLSSHKSLKFSRDNRWEYLGLVNEPCFEKATGPDPERFGLWLDKRSADCPPDPFENEEKYPGVEIGARGTDLGNGETLPVGSFYGYATGIVGLRLFPNPDFDAAARATWGDGKRFYDEKDTEFNNKNLVRPYRVGMSCAFCHVGPNPVKPPEDPENPKWENLSSNVGAQYFWIDRIFDWRADESSFVFQLFHTSKPGALDTSLVSSDNINNPRTMNAVYGLGPRLAQAKRFGKETLGGGSRENKQLPDYFEAPDTVFTPRVLKDGSDSVGALGALNRVYLNIGLFSEEWLLHFRPLTGGKEISPIKITDARKNSSYWNATEAQTLNMALFFLASTDPHKLKDAPGGDEKITKDANVLKQGRKVFAETCARCHSSKLPEPLVGMTPDTCSGKNYLACWNKYWEWTKTEEFKEKMRVIVEAPDFLDENYLSTEFRVPVTLLQTNACSPLATNAIKDNIWDNFSSDSYKELPAVGKITVYSPMTGEPSEYDMPGGGRGYTRPASLISAWSTAPFLLNNSLGNFESSPSVDARLASFDDSIEKLLWPKKREYDEIFRGKTEPGMGSIDRTTATSYLSVSSGYLPDNLSKFVGWGEWIAPSIFGEGGIRIGPIPKGAPVSLLANLNVRPDQQSLVERGKHDVKLFSLIKKIKDDLKALDTKEMDEKVRDEQARKVFVDLVKPLMELSKCPDYVINRGHYFGTSFFKEEQPLSDQEKRALIEYIKTF